MKRRLIQAMVLTSALAVTAPVAAVGRRVVFVDSGRSGGTGTFDRPFATLAEAQRGSNISDVIFLAEASTPYEENIVLKKGQMLIGSAFGLDALRTETSIEIDAPPIPAAQGSGPVIHGTISLAGDNVVAGCTIFADKTTGVALSAQSPDGPITLRATVLRTANDAYGLYIDNNAFAVSWTGGRLDAVDRGSGILINGGNGNITIDHVPIAGDFGTAIAVSRRSGGTIVFRNGSPIKIGGASREAITLTDSRGSVTFDSPVQIKTNGGRGLIVNRVDRVAVLAGASWIETTNGTALDVRHSDVNMVYEHICAEGAAPGRLTEAIIADQVRGRLEITEGTIRNALSYAMRLTQSTDVHVRKLDVSGGGTVAAREECPEDIAAQTNVRCRAALYLRHIERSSFENITITDNAGVGVNANNLTDVSFADVRIMRTGDRQSEPALLLDEARGAISFTRCSFIDGGGGGVVIEQRFNKARVTFDRCEIAAPERPTAAAKLFQARVGGSAMLDLQLLNAHVHDNAASGVSVQAKESGSVILTVRGSHFDRLGSTALELVLGDAATGCIDAADAEAVRQNNGGVLVAIDPRATYGIGPCDSFRP